jgi:CRP-like cAMP-binding protein
MIIQQHVMHCIAMLQISGYHTVGGTFELADHRKSLPATEGGSNSLYHSLLEATARRDLFSSVTFSTGGLVFRCTLPGQSEPLLSVTGSRKVLKQEKMNKNYRTRRRTSRINTGNFWAALDPTEREALRSVASSRTFAAGARIMQQGDRADHVVVILSGRTRISVTEDGRELVLAERGLGQLIGERGALQVSVRSATVVTLETVWALVVETKDFAAFLTAHPRVLALVEDQCNSRYADDRPAYGLGDHASGSYTAGPTNGKAVADQSDHVLTTRNSRKQRRRLNGENCTVFLTDVVEFGARTRNDNDRRIIREALARMTRTALKGMPEAWSEDRGDGLLTVVPPNVSTAKVMDQLLEVIPAALTRHNAIESDSARFQLRLAINVGPLASDTMGVSGEAIILVARLIEAQNFKDAVARSDAGLGVIASTFVYETVIRHGSNRSEVASYTQVPVEVKESDTVAWMTLLSAPVSPCLVPQHPALEFHPSPLAAHGARRRSSRARVSSRLASDVALRASVRESQRSGASSFSARVSSGV